MKKFKTNILSLVVLFLVSITGYAQDVRTTTTKIADILQQMPAKNIEVLNKNLDLALSLGNEGISGMLQMLKPAGQGDDVAVRYTLTSLARYSSQKGQENNWAMVQNNFLKAIETVSDKEIGSYLIHQLNYKADEAVVDPLKKYLKDERLCEPVTQLFLNIKTPKVEQAFTEALNGSAGRNQITLVKALGELKSKNSAEAISGLAGSGNIQLQRAVLAALANTGNPASYDLLWQTSQKAGFKYEPTEATASFLKYINELGKNGQSKLCQQGCLAVISVSNEKDLLHNKVAAIEIYSRYFPKEAMNLILKSVASNDSSYRMGLLNIAKGMGDNSYTWKWIKTARKSSPEIKADIVYMLGERNDKKAISFVQESLKDNSPEVRRMAIWSLVKLDPSVAGNALLANLSQGTDVTDNVAALNTLIDEKKLDEVAALFPKASAAGKAGLINIIAAKSGNRFFSQIYGYTSDEDPAVRNAAVAALKRVSSLENLNELLKLLDQSNDPAVVKDIQQALIAAVSDDTEKATAPLLAALKNSNRKEKIVPVLASIGSSQVLKEVAVLYETGTGTLRQTSFKALVDWNNAEAAPYLLNIVNSNNEFRNDAFRGYVNQVRRSGWPDDQKLLKLQMIMPMAQSNEEKLMVINTLARVKTFLSLVYTGKYLDDPALRQAASYAVAQIALPQNDSKQGFYGDIPKAILQKAISVMSGAESDYVKENVRRYLESMPDDPGFVSMFNGVDLSGWKGFITNPIKLASLNENQLAELQKKANEKMHFNWKVQDGMIVFNGDGDNLLSDREYQDFEMIVNWKISKKGDSGIYLRGTPQVQIWDTSRVEVGAQVGSGGLYNNKVNMSKPLKVADNPIEEWNTFRITMIGDKVSVYLNGELVVDNVTMENYWDRNIPIFPKGTIELQAHGTNLGFKDIYVHELKSQEYTLSSEEKAGGFVTLFNGKNLDGWIGNKKDYVVEEGNIVVKPSEGESGGNLYTEKEYSDFVFRFEFQLTPGANNGLGVRTPLKGDAAYVGMELQILDNTAAIYADLKPYQYHGSVYGVIPAKRDYLKPVGEWNYEEVVLNGSKIKITLNGTVIVDGDIKEASKNGTMDHKDHPGLLRETGHIGFLGHGSLVKFRNIRIKEIK